MQQNRKSFEQTIEVLRQQVRIPRTTLIVLESPLSHQRRRMAHAIAQSSGKTLYRIDLSTVVSKYIGETEKNLDEVFRKADAAGWILFFDEADALFGKRTDIRDAHDRYANLEISYLVKKIEQYRGMMVVHRQSYLLEKVRKARKFIVKFPPLG